MICFHHGYNTYIHIYILIINTNDGENDAQKYACNSNNGGGLGNG